MLLCPSAHKGSSTPGRMTVLAVAAVLLLSACGSPAADEGTDVGQAAADALPATPIPSDEDPGLVHVHGLGVNPSDGLVYAATHFGLWRLPETGQADRVGDVGYDLMGFTVVGPDHFMVVDRVEPVGPARRWHGGREGDAEGEDPAMVNGLDRAVGEPPKHPAPVP